MAQQNMSVRLKIKRDTAANWAANDPVLFAGEPAYDTTNGLLKIGDGISAWSALPSYTQVLSAQGTLPYGSWSGNTQSLSVLGVGPDNLIIIGPDEDSSEEYINCQVVCYDQSSGSLTFTAETTPISDLTINIVIFTPTTVSLGIDTSDATAEASSILSGDTAYVNGVKITGTYTPLDTSDANAVAGDLYLNKTAYVNGTKITGTFNTGDANAGASDILSGKTAYVNKIKLTGTYTPLNTADATAGQAQILNGYTAYVNGVKITGNYVPLDTSDANAIASDLYLNKTAYVNGTKITGTFNTGDANATASDILSGKTAYVNKIKLTGTYTPLNTSDATAGQAQILNGYTAYVNGTKITGNYVPLDTSDATAVAGDIASGKTAYVNGSKITGTATGGVADLIGSLTFSGTYNSATYISTANSYLAANPAENLVILVIKGGSSTSYENVIFASASLPSGVTIEHSGTTWNASVAAGKYYACLIKGVTAKINVACNMSARDATNDTVTATLTVTLA